MLKEFLSHKQTTALCDRNFQEWHQGIPYYGFWAISINNPECLATISSAQTHLQQFFLPGYRRQPHITLNACGLMSDSHFSPENLKQQICLIKSMNLSPFKVSVSHIDSFTTAAYLKISDHSQTLHSINKGLRDISSDSPPLIYQPHITLGLYRDVFNCKQVADEIIKFGTIEKTVMHITGIQFCRYHTSNIQGPIQIMEHIPF